MIMVITTTEFNIQPDNRKTLMYDNKRSTILYLMIFFWKEEGNRPKIISFETVISKIVGSLKNKTKNISIPI